MITFINESLFSKITEKRDGKDGRPDFYRTIVSSAMGVIDKKGVKESGVPKVIEHILHTEENNFNHLNTQIRLNWNENRPFVRLSQKESNPVDMQVYLIAIPYNGFIKPVPKSNMYRMYKGLTVTVEKPFDYEGGNYKHIAYITVVPNHNLLNVNAEIDEQTAEKQPCELVIDTYATGKDKITKKTTWKILFNAVESETQVIVSEEETEPVDFEQYRGKYIFPLPEKRKIDNNKPKTWNNNKPGGKYPPKKDNYKKDNGGNSRSFGTPVIDRNSRSFEDMLKDAEYDGNDKFSRKARRNKKGGKKRR